MIECTHQNEEWIKTMLVSFAGPRGGNLDTGLQSYALLAIRSFAKQLGISRLRTNIQVNLHHKLYVDKSNCSEGLCESVDQRHFIIDVALYGNWLSTLAHEMVHVKQFARGELYESINLGMHRWKGEWLSNNRQCVKDYWDHPWEIEAHGRETGLFIRWAEANDLAKYKWTQLD